MSTGLCRYGAKPRALTLSEPPMDRECYRYPPRGAVPDYLRALGGVLLCAVPMSTLSVDSPLFALLGCLVVGFLVFAWQTRRRQLTGFGLDDDNLIRWVGRGTGKDAYPWRNLQALQLAYYSVRRDGRRGWMELKLKFVEGSVRIDSRLEGFKPLACASARAAYRNELSLDVATVSNLGSLGIEPPSPSENAVAANSPDHD